MQDTEKVLGFTDLAVGEACLLQKLLLPREPLRGENFEITYLVRTYTEVGGDFLDYFLLNDGKLAIYMGDVVGKGLPAAIYAALAVGSLRSIQKTGNGPAAVLAEFNKCLRVRPVQSRYSACQYAVFDPATLKICVANAGLPLPLHLYAGGCSTMGEGGLPAGLFDVAPYEEFSFQLEPGDAVLFATDGLFEATDQNGDQLGMHRLSDHCAMLDYAKPDRFLRSLFRAIEQFTGGAKSDDMSAIVLRIFPRDEDTPVGSE